MPRSVALLLLVVACVAAAPRTALGALTGVRTDTERVLAPSTAQAGAHPDLDLSVRFVYQEDEDDLDDVKDVTFALAPGLVLAPRVVARCTQSQLERLECPSASKIGVGRVEGRGQTFSDPELTLDAEVFNMQPAAGEPARIGLLVESRFNNPEIKYTAPAVLRPDGGLEVTFADLTRRIEVFGFATRIRIDRVALTLFGTPPGASAPLVSNPTTCGPARSAVRVTSYEFPNRPVGHADAFTPTGCEALPFAPRLSAGLDVAAGGAASGASPVVRFGVEQGAGEATLRTAVLRLPTTLGPRLSRLASACSVEAAAAGTCPASARIGTARVATTLIDSQLTGPVFLVRVPGLGLPGLSVPLAGGGVSVRLGGTLAINAAGALSATVGGLPDLPLRAFALELAGGVDGILVNTRPPCLAGEQAVGASFIANNGRRVDRSVPLRVANCPGGLRATAAVSGVGRAGARPVLELRLRTTGARITGITLRLPKGLKPPKRRRSGLRATFDGRRPARALRGRRNASTVRTPKRRGVRRLRVAGRLRASKALERRVARGKRKVFRSARVTVRLRGGAVRRLRVPVRLLR